MIFFRKLFFTLLAVIPVFSFCQTNSDCSDVTISSSTVNGSYTVNSYLESDGIRDGNDYYGSTIYYPENTSGLLPSIIIIPGYANPELSIQNWGPFLASHGIVCMTIGTNSTFELVNARKEALQDALISLKGENNRINSPLFNKLDTNRIALGGWSMGGGGAQLVGVEDSTIKAIIALCPWIDPLLINKNMLNHAIPILFFSGQIDAVAPPISHANVQYGYTPNTTDKLLYEIFLGGHTIANSPSGGQGEVGRMALSWLKKYLINDSCYCPLLLDTPITASGYETNITCPSTTAIIDNATQLLLYPNPSNTNLIVTNLFSENKEYTIIGLDGRLIKKTKLCTDEINISFLKNGIYFLGYNGKKYKFVKN
jgi:dienelactone hydrolase